MRAGQVARAKRSLKCRFFSALAKLAIIGQGTLPYAQAFSLWLWDRIAGDSGHTCHLAGLLQRVRAIPGKSRSDFHLLGPFHARFSSDHYTRIHPVPYRHQAVYRQPAEPGRLAHRVEALLRSLFPELHAGLLPGGVQLWRAQPAGRQMVLSAWRKYSR